MLAYEELKGSTGRQMFFRPKRYEAAELFSGAPPKVSLKAANFRLGDISLTGISANANQSVDIAFEAGEVVPIVVKQAGITIFDSQAKVIRSERHVFGTKVALNLVDGIVDISGGLVFTVIAGFVLGAADANAALARRFQFASSADAEHWLVDTIARVYGIRVESVARLVISSANLIAWLSTDTGPLLAKCCALVNHHNRLLQLAALLHWLDQAHLPVSAPLLANTGEGQVRCAHLSLGVQRVIAGELLDPTQLTQAQAAGVTLANLHKALAVYPHTPLILPHPRLSRHYKPSSRIGLTRNAQRGLIPSSWLASTPVSYTHLTLPTNREV